MEWGAGVAAASVAGQTAFAYNRQNFMYDRKLRQKKEFAEMKFRICQAELWRQDIRDIIGLVETKTKLYLLVCMFFLGLVIQLWVQGRLPQGTPAWLMLGNQIANVGAFVFMLLTVWLAMHASVSAQAYRARLLTQLIRLPIPTWEEIEACRTYGSQFEKLEARQMFRVPWVLGPQEDLVPQETAAAPVATSASAANDVGRTSVGGVAVEGVAGEGEAPIDPWGLEGRAEVSELGCVYEEDCAKLRHIKIIRQAAKFWQGYDAYARISMMIGVNQMLVALSYFILGCDLVTDQAPWPAFTGVMLMIILAGCVAKLDMSLSQSKQLVIYLCLVVGPFFSCLACYHYGKGKMGRAVSKNLAPGAFFAHGLLVLCLTWFSQLKETWGGGLFPTAFKQILYLDVFGWISRILPEDDLVQPLQLEDETVPPASVGPVPSYVLAASLPQRQRLLSREESLRSSREVPEVGYYAMDYMDATGPQTLDDCIDDDEHSGNGEVTLSGMRSRCVDPALQAIAYDPRTGQNVPKKPQLFAPTGTNQDLRHLPDAPRMYEHVSNDNKPKAFFNASTFCPRVGSQEQVRRDLENEKTDPVVSGHDDELPGQLPHKIFMSAAILLGMAWMVACVYQLLLAHGFLVDFSTIHYSSIKWFNPDKNKVSETSHPSHHQHPSFLQDWVGHVEMVSMSLPFSHIRPIGLSCDGDGQNFAMTDGLSMFVAELAPKRKVLRNLGSNRSMNLDFKEIVRCSTLVGESLEDTAVACGGIDTAETKCDVMVLHRHGRRITRCPVAQQIGRGERTGSVAALSQRWLQNKHVEEKVAWLLMDAKCAASKKSQFDCASVGTTRGRVARLRHAEPDTEPLLGSLFPDDVMPDLEKMRDQNSQIWQPGMVRAINDRYLGVLQPEHNLIHVLDMNDDLAQVGILTLPVQARVEAFCIGGGQIHFLSDNAQMWRLNLPAKFSI